MDYQVTKLLVVNVISAEDLKDVNLVTKMDVYAEVRISGGSQVFMTPVSHGAGSNPTWNFPIKFDVIDSLADQNCQLIVFNIKSKRFFGDNDIGEVIVPVQELIDTPGDGRSPQFLSYQVRTPTGELKGQLHFSFKFGDVDPAAAAAANFNEPVRAYPVSGSSFAPYTAGTPYPPPPAVGYPYPPPQNGRYPSPPQGYGYPPPPQHPGYGAYPAQGGYGYPPSQEQAAYAYPQPYAAGTPYPPPPAVGYQYLPPQGYGYPPPPQHPSYGANPAQGGYGYPPVQQQQQQAPMGLGSVLLGVKLGILTEDMASHMAGMVYGYGW